MLVVAIRSYDWLEEGCGFMGGVPFCYQKRRRRIALLMYTSNGHVRLEQWGVEYEAKEKMEVME
jgi:hypothetical protein